MRGSTLIAVAAAALLAGCVGGDFNPNPLAWFDKPSGPKPAELPVLTNPQGVRVIWSANIGSSGGFALTPAIAGDSVYVAGRDGTVARLEVESGKAQWRVQAGTKLSGGVGSDGTTVAVASEEGEVVALEAGTGRIKWRSRVSSEVLAPPKLGDGLVLVRSADARIFAFDAVDGKRRWVYQRPASSLLVRSPVGLSIGQGLAYAGFSGGKLVAISMTNGQARWEGTVALPKGATELERVTDIVGEPSVLGREVCTAAYQGRVACYDSQNGNQIWTREMSSLTGVSFDARYAFISDDKGAVHALDRTNGRSVWKQDRLANRRLSLPQPIGTEVGVGDLQGYVHFLARESGAFLARAPTDGSPIRAAPQRLAEGILVQTQNGGLYALSPK